jgi:hypothetical protein
MPSRRQLSSTKPQRRPASGRSLPESRPGTRRPAAAPTSARRWRRDTRPRIVSAAVLATKALRWSPSLIEAVLEELYVDDHFEDLLGVPGALQAPQFPQALAVALILRHSWHPDDLACILKRLALQVDDPSF